MSLGGSLAGLSQALVQQLAAVCSQLRGFHGYRTLWLTPTGELWHTEPDEECERDNWRYLGTFFQPDPEEIANALVRPGAVVAA